MTVADGSDQIFYFLRPSGSQISQKSGGVWLDGRHGFSWRRCCAPWESTGSAGDSILRRSALVSRKVQCSSTTRKLQTVEVIDSFCVSLSCCCEARWGFVHDTHQYKKVATKIFTTSFGRRITVNWSKMPKKRQRKWITRTLTVLLVITLLILN